MEKFNPNSIFFINHVMQLVQMIGVDKDHISNQFHKYINLDQRGEELALDLIVNSGLLPAISNYLGAIPVLSDLKIIHSPINKLAEASQLYHCDGEDSRQVKIFFYITSQTEESGPLTLISAKDTQKLKEYNSVPLLGRIDDEVIERAKFQQIKLIGSSGDLALFDPSRVAHYGSRANRDSRVIVAYQFIRRDAPFGSFWFKLQDSHLIKKYGSTLASVCMT